MKIQDIYIFQPQKGIVSAETKYIDCSETKENLEMAAVGPFLAIFCQLY